MYKLFIFGSKQPKAENKYNIQRKLVYMFISNEILS